MPDTNTKHVLQSRQKRPVFCPSVDREQQSGASCRWPVEPLFCFVLCQHASLFDLLQDRAGGFVQDSLMMFMKYNLRHMFRRNTPNLQDLCLFCFKRPVFQFHLIYSRSFKRYPLSENTQFSFFSLKKKKNKSCKMWNELSNLYCNMRTEITSCNLW